MKHASYLLVFLAALGTPLGVRGQGGFSDYVETLPGTEHLLNMVAISGGAVPSQPQAAVSDFWMATTETTWDLFLLYLHQEELPTHPDRGPLEMGVDGISGASMPYINPNKAGYPAASLTQYNASNFCRWLSAITGRFYRLPTEAEWQYACEKGAVPDLSKVAWTQENSGNQFHPAGEKEPNSLGLYDLQGNLAEWTLDQYADGQPSLWQGLDPVNMPTELYPRVVRGGSYGQDQAAAGCASRVASTADWKARDPQFPKSLWWHPDAPHVGFRVVRPRTVPSAEKRQALWLEPITEY